MIAHLSGKLLAKQATSILLDVGGVGYEVSIPLSTFYELEDAGREVQLRIYTHVREDALQLYGFKTALERELFLQLISVSGIGPKLAITILSGMSASEIVNAIRDNNIARLTSIPGVGKKTAERLAVELRDKVVLMPSMVQIAEDTGISAHETGDAVRSDALSALVNLGYQKAAAERAITAAIQENREASLESVLRRSLRLLAKG